jgi:hypothetical protein
LDCPQAYERRPISIKLPRPAFRKRKRRDGGSTTPLSNLVEGLDTK